MTGIHTAASYWEQLFQFYRSVRIKMLPRMKKLWFKTNRNSIHIVWTQNISGSKHFAQLNVVGFISGCSFRNLSGCRRVGQIS